MSWFADLAGKAEDLLNLVDQGAATALSKSKDEIPTVESPTDYYQEKPQESRSQSYGKASFISSAADNIKHQKATLLAGTANVKSTIRTSTDISHSTSSNVATHRTASQFVRRKKSEPDDEQLFDFLNSSDKVHNGVLESKRENNKETVSTSQSGRSNQQSVKPPETTPPTIQGDLNNQPAEIALEDTEQDTIGSEPTPSLGQTNGDQRSQELSNLRLENQLLRSEVQSLNQEMAGLIQRSKEMQDELNDSRVRIEKWNGDNSKSDRTVRELRAQVDDLTEVVAAKDSQLAVLKVRLQEADQLLSSRTEVLEKLQNEKSRILQDHNEGSSLHSQALQTVQERLREAESTLKREQDGFKQMQSEFTTRLSKVEAERQNLAESIIAAEKKYMEEKRRGDDLQQQLKVAKASAETVKQEMLDYKQKATRILQSKEKLINSLKEGSGIEGLDSHATNTMELEEMRHERDLQREEIQKLLAQIQQLKIELQVRLTAYFIL
ncbi:hypothetical protein GDO81_019288 [Engystomops pustulosus]|uniref:Golgin subfamily A member 5 n=1 Tax=Engystomops pustulosus TaxID=76066 RepID=A0AAV6Z2E7_ENGPU|nr:hypothetical protein GDO81_019288 [Engystomops pustulosus]